MCDFDLVYRAFETAHGIRFDEYFRDELVALQPLAADGLLTIGQDAITVTPRGRLLVRAICMVFDRYVRENRRSASYSKVI